MKAENLQRARDSVYDIKASIHWSKSQSGIQNVLLKFLELINNYVTKHMSKIYSRIDLYYRFEIWSTFEFSNCNDLSSLRSVNNQRTDLDDISRVGLNQTDTRKNVAIC